MDSDELRCTEPNDTPVEGTLVGGALDPEADFSPGAKLGRYVVLSHMGSGGMGVVYAAYDPKLDRRIALKLMHQRGDDEERAERASQRMLSEAKAMAALSHPNVISVHDVGTIDQRVYIAMEFVEGVPMSDWMRAPNRNWKELLDVFTKAGRGLEAAHDAGIVHRDFKPDNVLVGADARVRVLDFGLARRFDGTHDTAHTRDREAGTPAYMSPEQHLGKTLDHRADQFSFCVALYEALYSEMPFAAKTRLELALAVTDGRVGPAPRRAAVPNWLRYVLLRGLDPDPEGRWTSMGELLNEINRDPSVRWPKIAMWAAGAVASVGALATVVVMLVGPKVDVGPPPTLEPLEQCAVAASEERAEVWDDARAEAVRAAFASSSEAWAGKLGPQVEADLASWADAWESMHRDTCEATVRGSQSPTMLDQRMLCLHRQGTEFGEFVAVIGGADVESLQSAAEGVAGLPDIQACTREALTEAAPVVERDPETREQIVEIEKLLSRTNSLALTAAFTKANEAAAKAVELAKGLGDDALLARALLVRAQVALAQGKHDVATPLLEDAEFAADRAGDDQRRGEILIELARVDANFGDAQAAHRKIREARAVLDRVDASVVDYARLDGVSALALASEGKLAEAEAEVRAALESLAEVVPPPVELGRLHLILGVLQRERGNHDEARAALSEARDVWTKHYGPQHPIVAEARVELARLDAALGAYEVAAAGFQAALEINEGALGGSSLAVAEASEELGLCLGALGRHKEAIRSHQRARAIFRAHGSEAAVELALALDAEGVVQRALGQFDEALSLHQSALRELEGARRHRSFRPFLVEAVMVNVGEAQLELEQVAGARATTTSVFAELGAGTVSGSDAQLVQARAAWLGVRAWTRGEDQNPERAQAYAETARAGFEVLGRRAELEAVEAWLSEQP